MLFNTSDFVFIFVWLAVTLHLLAAAPSERQPAGPLSITTSSVMAPFISTSTANLPPIIFNGTLVW
jgi:hypothetical protein